MAIQFLRGTSTTRSSSSTVLKAGQPFYETDTGKLLMSSSDQAASAATPILARPILDYVYPVGSIYMSVNSTNPSSLFGGTWTQWGQGRVPVGVADSGTFNSVEATGGEEKHQLTVPEMPLHEHTGTRYSGELGYSTGGALLETTQTTYTAQFSTETATVKYAKSGGGAPIYEKVVSVAQGTTIGGNQLHNNLQPYITCYMWKRTA